MAVQVTLSVDPKIQKYDRPITFSGRVTEDGSPVLTGITVYDVVFGDTLASTNTDEDGYYSVEWVPGGAWVGTYEVWALAAYLIGHWSDKVTITVTEEEPPTPKRDILGKVGAALGSAAFVAVVVHSARKR